jgi:O-succinylbenzoic acid--CoA ligase
LPDWLRRRALVSPDHPAVVCGEDAWSFRDLDARADAAAERLRQMGVEGGDRVALLAGNSAAFAQVVFGVARAGAVLVPLNLRLTPEEVGWQLGDCGASLLVTDREEWGPSTEMAQREHPHPKSLRSSRFASPLPAAGEGTKSAAPRRIWLAEVAVLPGQGAHEDGENSGFDADAVQAIMYTSGTSGRPKGAMLTFGNFFWSAFGSMAQLGVHDDDRWLATLPLFHVGGMSILFRSVINGTTAVVHEGFDPAQANRAIDEEGVTIVSLVSTMLLRMLEARQDRPFPSSLRCVLLGGGPVPQELVEKGLRLNIPIAQTYGLTETASQATTLQLAEVATRAGSAGKPLLPVELRVERDDGSAAAAGEAGEIVVRGATVSPGYWQRPEATAAAIRDGWLHTGDAGYLDADGYLYVIDRRDDLIVSGGENVYPAEVESILSTHPGVREAAVFALADPTWGQSVAAAVVLREGLGLLTAEALQVFCRERLAAYKAPRAVFFTDDLPRTASGKLLRRELRARFSKESA